MPIVVGGGSITGLATGGINGSALASGTVTQAKIADGVTSSGPAFSAYATGAQTLSNGVATKVAYQAEEFDTGNCFDSTTNYRFTPNVAGYYQITGSIYWNTSMAYESYLFLYKNGSIWKCLSDSYANGTYASWLYFMSGTILVYANGTTDYFETYAYQSTGGSKSTNLTGPQPYVYFQGFLVRAA